MKATRFAFRNYDVIFKRTAPAEIGRKKNHTNTVCVFHE